MIILDTNVVSELMKPQPDEHVLEWLTQLGDETLATTIITVTEIEFGLQRLPDGRRKAALFAHFETYLEALTVLPFDQEAARIAGRFLALRQAAGFTAQLPDMMIAGSVATQGARLATRNLKDFETLPITVINPWHA